MVTKRLLVIDDDCDNQILVKLALNLKTKWQVITASSGMEGVSKAQTIRPDAILLDLMLPDLDGIAVYELLKCNSFTREIPVIFMTAMSETEVISQLEAEVEGIIVKPFDVISLSDRIAKICDWHLTVNSGQ